MFSFSWESTLFWQRLGRTKERKNFSANFGDIRFNIPVAKSKSIALFWLKGATVQQVRRKPGCLPTSSVTPRNVCQRSFAGGILSHAISHQKARLKRTLEQMKKKENLSVRAKIVKSRTSDQQIFEQAKTLIHI